MLNTIVIGAIQNSVSKCTIGYFEFENSGLLFTNKLNVVSVLYPSMKLGKSKFRRALSALAFLSVRGLKKTFLRSTYVSPTKALGVDSAVSAGDSLPLT